MEENIVTSTVHFIHTPDMKFRGKKYWMRKTIKTQQEHIEVLQEHIDTLKINLDIETELRKHYQNK